MFEQITSEAAVVRHHLMVAVIDDLAIHLPAKRTWRSRLAGRLRDVRGPAVRLVVSGPVHA